MSDEFALCWNNFTDNIKGGFQSLLFHGGALCDVTIAVDGKLLQAHKLVLSICSPYFQEMFVAMPASQHPILIFKDMSFSLVTNLLEFIYQGSVNVKQDELQAFMKIAETLQVKGLSTSTNIPSKDSSEPADKNEEVIPKVKRLKKEVPTPEKVLEKKRKEAIDLTSDDEIEQIEDQFQIIEASEVSMEPSYENENQKLHLPQSSSFGLKIFEAHSLNNVDSFEPSNESNMLVEMPYKSSKSNPDVSNESNVTMLSSTCLLHGNCIFNRNNTVATQAGLKTYWLCKSYRISMCKARCITHQGKVISATGVHNHQPHMENKPHEIPIGYTANTFNPSPANEYLSSNQATSNILSQQTISYSSSPMYSHHLHEQLDNQIQCKTEQI